jgi:HSP20 family protein
MTQGVTKLPVIKEARAGEQDSTLAPPKNLQREVNQLFDQFDRGWRPFFRSPIFDYVPMARLESYRASPAVDILDRETSYEVAAEVPGIGPDNLEVKIIDGRLLIKGDKRDNWERNEGNCHLSERHYGAFERSFSLPEGTDPDKIEASLSNGVLTVVVPKGGAAAKNDPRKVEVKAA